MEGSVEAPELDTVQDGDREDEKKNGPDGDHVGLRSGVGPALASGDADGKLGRRYEGRMLWRRRLQPIAQPLFRAYSRVARGMTLGVRGVVLNEARQVLLVEHTYIHGWHLPGGGVERGEAAEEALERELVEEAGVKLNGPPALVAIHMNRTRFRGDHVLLYRIEDWTPCPATSVGEIHQVEWFAPDALPVDATQKTRLWVAEAVATRRRRDDASKP
jgi:8-oxo-dGTP pyrophosphatase MutT (NUDIX family)